MSTIETAYVPGECNINSAEIAKRRNIGHVGLVVLIIILVILIVIGANRYYRILLFLPAILSANGYLQAKNRFCVGYAMSGKQNARQGSSKASAIIDDSAREIDKNRAKSMNLQTTAIALIVTIIVLLLPD